MSQVSERYAKALFQLAEQDNNLETVQGVLQEIGALIKQNAQFAQFLQNPLMSFEERAPILKALFEGKVPENVTKFLLFISYKNRLNQLSEIIEAFDALFLTLKNQIRVDVHTALPLPEQDQAVFVDHLQKKLNHQVIAQWSIDPNIIGGFQVLADGKLYDYSFKNQLNTFFQQMTQKA